MLIGSVIYQVQNQERVSNRNLQLYRLNEAIRGARSLHHIPRNCKTILTKEVLSLSKDITAFRAIKDHESVTDAVFQRLGDCGIPYTILEAARQHIKATADPDYSPLGFRSKRVISLEKELDRRRKESIGQLLSLQTWIVRQLKRHGYQPKEKP